MGKYRYEIKENNDNKLYYFVLYPNNIINQEIGRSIEYSNQNDCWKAWKDFKKFVVDNEINNYESNYIKVEKQNGWIFKYIRDGKVIFYRNNGYDQKINAQKIILSIYKHINADLVL